MGKHSVVILDPPWSWATYSDKGRKKAPKYETMSDKDLLALYPTIAGIAGKDSVMLLWATRPRIELAFTFMKICGFKYKTMLEWRKPNVGNGYWARDNAEIVLIGTRGKVRLPNVKKKLMASFDAPRESRRHSSKPLTLHTWVEEGYPYNTKIELFARRTRPGWITIGGDLGTWITPDGIKTRDGEDVRFVRVTEIEDQAALEKYFCSAEYSKGQISCGAQPAAKTAKRTNARPAANGGSKTRRRGGKANVESRVNPI